MSKLNKILLAVGTIGLIVLISMLLIFHFETAPAWQEKYELGVRYLSEGNYQEAIIAFTSAIEIDSRQANPYVGRGDAYTMIARELSHGITDPDQLGSEALDAYQNAIRDYQAAIERDKTNTGAYQKIANDYIEMGDTTAAVEILEQGLQDTKDESIQQSLDDISGVFTVGEILPNSPVYAALEDFLLQFRLYIPDYNARNVVLAANYYGTPMSLLEILLTGLNVYCYNDTIYPGEQMKEYYYWETDENNSPDMMTIFEKMDTDHIGKVSIDKMDWLLQNIFNCSPSDISQMKSSILAGENENIYSRDGYYYFPRGDSGSIYYNQVEITKLEQAGSRYDVEYNMLYIYPMENRQTFEPYYAQVSLKEIDGISYWTIYTREMIGRPCGENVTWTVQSGVLTISGMGPMMDYNLYPMESYLIEFSDESAPPWVHDHYAHISIKIEEGVTSIGDNAFRGKSAVEYISIPKSVTYIGTGAFEGCTNLTDVYYAGRPDELPNGLPDSVTVHYNTTEPIS